MKSITTNAESSQRTATLTIDQADGTINDSTKPAGEQVAGYLQQAIAHHRQGQLQEAERLYRDVLRIQPDHPDANHNLGVLAVQVKQPAAGLPHFKIALESVPNRGQYWLSYIDALIQAGQADAAKQVLAQGRQRGLQGEAVEALAGRIEGLSGSEPSPQEINRLVALFAEGKYAEAAMLAQALTELFPLHGVGWKALGAVLKQMGRSEDALLPMQKAVVLLPEDAEAHNNLGGTFRDMGRLEEAEASYRRALEIKPVYAEAYYNLGTVLGDLGQLDRAVASFHRALEIKPDYAEVYSNLGITLQDMGRLDEAEASYRQALAIKPSLAEAHGSLGVTLQELGRLSEAETSLRQALVIKPDLAEAHYNLGLSCQIQGHFSEAEASLRRALEIKPDYAEAHNNLGNTLKKQSRLSEAEASLRRALEIKPDYAEAHSNLGNVLKDLGQLDSAVTLYLRALEIKPDLTEAHSNLLLIHNYRLDQPAVTLLAEARRYGEQVARKAHPFSSWRNVPDTSKRLRIGLVSGDLHSHPVGFFLESVLSTLISKTSGQIEIFAYSGHSKNDVITERIKASCQTWYCAARLSDEALARRIHDDNIDILIDLSGHTAHNRLPMFAWKPAPVQVSWLGYFATTGVAEIDYLIADPWTLPETEEAYFTEKIWRLPETRLCFTPPDKDVEVTSLPALTNGYVTFGCFNNLAKMNENVVALWARVLAAVPNSRLFLKAKQLKDDTVRQHTIERFAAHGIDADRLILERSESRTKYLTSYQRVDITLDPFPYPGGTTSVESLWMGVPVLTLAGERFLSRQGVGILMNTGLPQWIATDQDDYVSRAVAHAGDLQRLAALRSGLRQQLLASPITNAPRFARHFEAALRGMWQIWCEHQKN